MKSLVIGMILLLLLVTGAVALAQDEGGSNDPATDPNANACYTGGSLEGKCGTSDLDHDGVVEDWEVNLMWTCGWYLIRYEHYGIPRSAVPQDCEFLLPPIPEAPAPAGPVCYNAFNEEFILYFGPANKLGNFRYDSPGCSGVETYTPPNEAVVIASSQSAAQVICESILGGGGVANFNTDEGFNTPSNYWHCSVPV